VKTEEMAIARHWLGKDVPVTVNTHATIEKLLATVSPMLSMLRLYNK
jgi:hypothetical protein